MWGILRDMRAQLNGRGKQLDVRFTPLCSIRQFIGIVEYALQPTEAGILPQYLALLGILRRATGHTETKGKPYRLDVVAHNF